MNSKLGMNICGLHPQNDKRAQELGQGIWNPELDTHNPLVSGRLAVAGVKWLRYPGGLWNRKFTLGESLQHRFTLDNFILCCQAIGAVPILTVCVFFNPSETVEIINHVRKSYDGPLYIEMGNESYLGKASIDGRWPIDITGAERFNVIQYIQWMAELRALTVDMVDLHYLALDVRRSYQESRKFSWTDELATTQELFDGVSVHVYGTGASDEFSDVVDKLEAHHIEFPDKPLYITEWNMSNGAGDGEPIGHGSLEHLKFCYRYLNMVKETDYIACACYWELGGYWKIINHDGSPLRHWTAFELQ